VLIFPARLSNRTQLAEFTESGGRDRLQQIFCDLTVEAWFSDRTSIESPQSHGVKGSFEGLEAAVGFEPPLRMKRAPGPEKKASTLQVQVELGS
jgi:hypothetical protein